MNSTQLLLLGLLVWFAMSNKSKDTRNVILVVAGILFFCMMNVKEGFDLVEVPRAQADTPNMREVLGTPSRNTFKFNATDENHFLLDGDSQSTTLRIPWTPTPSPDITCALRNGQTGIVEWAEGVNNEREAAERAFGFKILGHTAAEQVDILFTCAEVQSGTDCVGSWSRCGADCGEKTFSITTAQDADRRGTACEAAHGDTAQCAPGDGDGRS